MIQRLAILRATGDLTARYLLPGLAALRAAGVVISIMLISSALPILSLPHKSPRGKFPLQPLLHDSRDKLHI